MRQTIIHTSRLEHDLTIAVSECEHDRIFILCDETTARLCLPVVAGYRALQGATTITIPATDAHKDLASLTHVWESLSRGGATRHSVLIALGGGMVTDLGGLAAATFKRGIDFINVPTTLLAQVDASVGGKTGINLGGLKNEIGVFRDARYVIISPRFLETLDAENLRSGYAEMLKHGLISGREMWARLLDFPLEAPDLTRLAAMVEESVGVKERIVEADPLEHGLRKALNLGHTFGHALESLMMERGTPVLHGYAVAWGLIPALYLSATRKNFPADCMRQTTQYISRYYGQPQVTCDDYDRIVALMRHDKKNTAGEIRATLLADVGAVCTDQTLGEDDVREALDFLTGGM